jgi:carbonic anhydrase
MVELDELMKRNKAFSDNADKKKMKDLCAGQKPHTIILTCSDSRVVPEFIFGCGLGELFVIRVAGNVACDCDVLASLEYAAEHLGSKTVLVLGHTNCGAVCTACQVKGDGEVEGNIGKLLCQVMPAVEKTNRQSDKAIEENVRLQISNIKKKSNIMSHLVDKGEVKIVGAVYDMLNGKVKLLEI